MNMTLAKPILLLSIVLLPSALSAAEISIDSNTIFRIEKRDMIGSGKDTIMPATEFIGFDANRLADTNLSFHFYGWGRMDLKDKSYNDDNADAGFTYGYLRYRFNSANADVRAGRFFVHEGIVNEQVDGVSARTDLPLGFGISAFGGAPVHGENLYRENSDGKGDSVVGGRLNYRFKGILDLGVSTVYEGKTPDLLYHTNGEHRLVGGDIWLTPISWFELIGHTSYNTKTSTVAEHSYLANIRPLKRLTLSAQYNESDDQSLFYSWAAFSGAALPSGSKTRTAATTVSYEFSKNVEASTDFKHYKRDKGEAERYGGNLKFKFMENSLRTGIGYHYLRAGEGFAIDSNPTASYQEARTYAMYDSKTYFTAIDLIGQFFKNKVYNKSNALEGRVSIGYHITPTLAVSGDISCGKNPEFTSETKGLIRLTYNPVFDGKGDKK
ncbi:MAG: hypothetical protein HXX17_03415 [Geobacteraceae bacterium]|nr:hypothetical protein [Geobacteraceae bacterium]